MYLCKTSPVFQYAEGLQGIPTGARRLSILRRLAQKHEPAEVLAVCDDDLEYCEIPLQFDDEPPPPVTPCTPPRKKPRPCLKVTPEVVVADSQVVATKPKPKPSSAPIGLPEAPYQNADAV